MYSGALMHEKDKIYAKLWNAQARYYADEEQDILFNL